MANPSAAVELHRDALIIDGLIFFSDGFVDDLRAGNVAAINLTVADFQGDFGTTCDDVAAWLDRASEPDSPWRLVETTDDILEARSEGKVGLIMGWQNMRPIEDKLARLRLFHRLGVRIMQLTYNERNFLGDGCLEVEDGGLSQVGKQAVREMNELGIAIDLSHVGERTCLETAEITEKPLLITHANAKAIAKSPRNKSDAVIKAVAGSGGLIGATIYGVMCWDGNAERRPSLADFIRNLDYMVDLVGIEHVALGTDLPAVSHPDKIGHILARTLTRYPSFMSAYARAFGNDVGSRYLVDCSSSADLPQLTSSLLQRGWSEAHVRAVLGENLLRVLGEIWRG